MTKNEYHLSISVDKSQDKFSTKMATLKSFLISNEFTMLSKDDSESWFDMTVTKNGSDTELIGNTQSLLNKMRSEQFRVDILLKQHKPSIMLEQFSSEEFSKIMVSEESNVLKVINDKPNNYILQYENSDKRNNSLQKLFNEFKNKQDNIIKYWDETILLEVNSFTEKKKMSIS